MAISDWPLAERPREKLIQRGPRALSDAELLAIFLRTGVAGRTAVDLARDLLRDFGGLCSLMGAGQKEFCQAHGMGVAKYVQLQAVLEMSRRYLYETMQTSEPLTSPAATRQYLQAHFHSYQQEVFLCLFLDSQHQVLASDELFYGTIDGASVHPREVVKSCLKHNAAAVILAHNHPSGIAEPSQADRRITERLKEALALVDIRVLDHLVIGRGDVISFAERGWI